MPSREVIESDDFLIQLQQSLKRLEPMKPATPVTSQRVGLERNCSQIAW